MKVIVVLFLVAFTLCKAQRGKEQYQEHECPQNCRCDIVHDANEPGTYYKMATCTSFPTYMHQTVRSLQVRAKLDVITKQMISGLGKGLRILDLTNCSITKIEKGAFSSSLPYLLILKLSNNQLTVLEKDTFLSPILEELYLDGNVIREMHNDTFIKLVKLKELHLQQNSVERFTVNLPFTLVKLDVSDNSIQTAVIDLTKVPLYYLNLCNNPLQIFPVKSSTNNTKLKILCLSDKGSQLPYQTAIKFPELTNLTLLASKKQNAMLDIATQTELEKLNKLMSLTIGYYDIQDLQFLSNKTNLIVLTLKNITLHDTIGLQEAFQSMQSLSTLNLDWSPGLIWPVLGNNTIISYLTSLNYLSIRHTELVSLGKQNVPSTTKIIDIAENPLRCDCNLSWIVTKLKTDPMFLKDFSHSTCVTENLNEEALVLVVGSMECPNSNGKLEQTEEYEPKIPTGQNTTMKMEHGQKYNDHTLLYIVLGSCLLVLIVVGIVLAIVLTMMKKRRKCQISPEGDTPMEQQQQMKQSSSSDMLVKK